MRRSLGMSLIAFSFSLISACGGGGGGSGGNTNSNGNTGAATAAKITRSNAKEITQAALAPTIFSDNAVDNISYDFNYFRSIASGQMGSALTVSENQQCSSGGSYQLSGTVSATGDSGDVTITYVNCTTNYNWYESYTYNGTIQVKLQAVDGSGNPVKFEYIYRNFLTDYRSQNQLISSGVTDGIVNMTSANQVKTSLTVKDLQSGDSISTADFESIYTPNPYPYSAQRSGHVIHSKWGIISVSSGAINSNTSFIIGATQAKIRVIGSSYSFGYFDLSLDENGDGNYDSFAGGFAESFDAIYTSNTAPTVNVDYSLIHPGTNQAVNIPLNGIYDSENDFLNYSARVVQTPGNANINLTLTENRTLSFQTHGRGDYIIELTVSDGNGGITTQNISMHVSLPEPQVTPVYNSNINVGDTLLVNLQASNSEAGPFIYKLNGAPAGMTIDANGVLHWQANQSFFPTTEVQISVDISNADHTITVPLQLTLHDANKALPLTRSNFAGPSLPQNTFILDLNNDGSKEILTTDNSAALYSLKYDNGNYAIDWMYPYAIGKGNINYIHPFDTDQNGLYEIVVQTGGIISIIGETRNATVRSVDVSTSLSQIWYSIYAHGVNTGDIDNDSKQEIVVLIGSGSGARIIVILDAETLSEKWRSAALSLGNNFVLGNVDADSALEIITAGGYVFDGATHNNEWLYSGQFGESVASSDINGDGTDEIFGINPQNVTAFSAVSKSQLWQSSLSYYANYAVQFAQLDADADKEIIVNDYISGAISTYDATLTNTTQKWSTNYGATYTWMDSVVGDINQDNSNDLIQAGATGLRVFDLTTRNTSFANIAYSSYSIAKSFSGGLSTDVNSNSLAIFAASASSNETKLIGINLSHGTIQSGPSIYIYSAPDMCLADYDNDGAPEIFITAASSYPSNDRLTAFDFASSTKKWSRTSSSFSYSPRILTCNDFNNDGHTDVAGTFDGTLEIDDPFHQNQIWADASNTSYLNLSSADLDGDSSPELIVFDQGSVKVYKRSGSSYQISNSYSVHTSNYYYTNVQLSVQDINGDGLPEIIIAIPNTTTNETTQLIALNKDLSELSRTQISGTIDVLAPEAIGNGQVLAAIHDEQNYYASPTRYRVEAIDVASGHWVWRSPMLLSQVNANSLHIHAAGTANPRLIIGTQAAAIITH